MEELRSKFRDEDLRRFGDDTGEWVKLSRISVIFRNHVRDATQVTLLKTFSLAHRVVVSRGKESGQVLDLAAIDGHGNDNPQFNSAKMAVYVNLQDVFNTDQMRSMMLNPRKTKKKAEPISRNVVARLAESSDVRSVAPDVPAERGEQYPVIRLESHELFRNADESVVDVEIRGARSQEKILFKAKDIGKYFGMPNLISILIRAERSQYQEGVDYVVIRPSLGKNSDWDAVFLTYVGFIRVIFVSTSGNENRSKMVNWSLRILYTHHLGSDEERCEVASDLLKFVLNLKLCGLYFIDFGTVSDLYEKEFPVRYKDLKSKYGQYSQTITFRWILLVPKGQLKLAEDRLKELVDEYEMKLHFKKYRELVIYDPVREHELKGIYNRIAEEFPAFDFDKKLKELGLIAEAKFAKKETEFTQEISDLKVGRLTELLQLKDAHAKEVAQLKDAHAKDVDKIHELEKELLRKDMEIQRLEHRHSQR